MSQYEIQKSIGIGSFGQVFLARHIKSDKIFVIKKIKIKDISPKDKENIQTEIELLRDFKHVNIVSYKDSFIDNEGVLNIVMQNCEEGDMYHKIRSTQGKKFDESQIIDWAIQMCLAIYHMHDRRILHRDLKTQNIFLTNGKIKLGDFGISKVLDATAQLTSTVIGTPYYMSPEQFKYKPYSYKTDIWALGCVIYEMCSLRHAFDAQSINALAVKVLKGNFAPLSSNYSKGLRELIGKMLSVNPRDRPTVVQVLKAPILRKRLVSYIQSCMKQPLSEYNNIESLVIQAEKLGIPLTEETSASTVITSNHSQHHLQFNSVPQSISATEAVRSSSKEPPVKSIGRSESHQRLYQRRMSSKEEGKRQKKDKSAVEDQSRRHQQDKKSEDKKLIEKRNELLEKQRQKRKKLASQQRMRRNASSQRKLHHDESLPLLCDTDSKRKIEAPIPVPTSNRPKTKLPEISASSSGGIPPPSALYVQTPQPQPVYQDVPAPKFYPSVQAKPIAKKPFKMEEQYDMDFQQEQQQEYTPVIEEGNEEDDIELPNKQLLTEKPMLPQKEVTKQKNEPVQITEKSSFVLVEKQPPAKPIEKLITQPKPKATVKDEGNRSIGNIMKSQYQISSQDNNINSQPKISDSFVPKVKQQKKSLNETPPSRKLIHPTKTELEYSNSSSDEKVIAKPVQQIIQTKPIQVQRQPNNQRYINIQKKIQSLKARSQTVLGSKIYSELYNFAKTNMNYTTNQQSLRSKVLDIVDQKNIGHWHYVDQILQLESVLKEVSPFIK